VTPKPETSYAKILIPKPETFRTEYIIEQLNQPKEYKTETSVESVIDTRHEAVLDSSIDKSIRSIETILEKITPATTSLIVEVKEPAKSRGISIKSVGEIAEISLNLKTETHIEEVEIVVEENSSNEAQLMIESSLELIEEIETLEARPEYVESHTQLMNLIIEMLQPAELSEDGWHEINLNDEASSGIEIQINETNSFEKYIESQTYIETTYTLEEIVLEANDQELETTLIQLAEFVSVPPLESEETRQSIEKITDIKKLISEIHQELFTHYLESDQNFETAQIVLLRVVGYEEPDKALIKLITKYGINFLLDALLHLYQLTNKDERFEFEPRYSKLYIQYPQGLSLISILGQTLFQLMGIEYSPQAKHYI
jgi:hypothetical protein